MTEQDMKYFGHEKLFSRMLSDIRDIEENGIVTSSAMNDIDTLIKEALPMCGTPDKLQPILDALQNLGVKTVEDMKLVQKDDLAGVLKPIQERKLLAHVNKGLYLEYK
ncbi:hypothetical protein ROHU_023872 [Labeo rohita]|uniref:Uncharacterized protein n=1 Tax=Labeo rohita TaxID=84645 RepID=A0A498MKT7_LABRO|nr:hypothetical protein ROHU_023872 [Labeo rohita]